MSIRFKTNGEMVDVAGGGGGTGGGASSADQVSITDAGDHFTGTNVEAALQELATSGGGGGGTSTSYNTTLASTGSGTVAVTHNLGTEDVSVTVRRIAVPAGTTYPLGSVIVRWYPTDVNTITIDFDTYARTANEFRVKVST